MNKWFMVKYSQSTRFNGWCDLVECQTDWNVRALFITNWIIMIPIYVAIKRPQRTRTEANNRLMTTMTMSINKNNEPIFRTSVIDRITKWKSHTKRERERGEKSLVISNYNISSELHFVNTDDRPNNAINCFSTHEKNNIFSSPV